MPQSSRRATAWRSLSQPAKQHPMATTWMTKRSTPGRPTDSPLWGPNRSRRLRGKPRPRPDPSQVEIRDCDTALPTKFTRSYLSSRTLARNGVLVDHCVNPAWLIVQVSAGPRRAAPGHRGGGNSGASATLRPSLSAASIPAGSARHHNARSALRRGL
jgi:hypothetical protein